MTTRTLTMEIPEPESDGRCSRRCLMWSVFHYCIFADSGRTVSTIQFPGHGCPWHTAPKESEAKR
jgi:hypothetical protein